MHQDQSWTEGRCLAGEKLPQKLMYLPQMEMTGFDQMPGINLPHKTMGNPECWIFQKRHPKKADNQQIDNQLADNQLAENELAEERRAEMGEVKAQKRGTRERQGQKSRRLMGVKAQKRGTRERQGQKSRRLAGVKAQKRGTRKRQGQKSRRLGGN